jgi:putative membrane protein insertion efficiency factor
MKITDLPKNTGKYLIKIYQKTLSLDHSFWGKKTGYRVCIYHPSCSEYTYEAVDKFGLIRGSTMGFFRILRCGPWSLPGYDFVPDHFSIKRNKDINNDKMHIPQ